MCIVISPSQAGTNRYKSVQVVPAQSPEPRTKNQDCREVFLGNLGSWFLVPWAGTNRYKSVQVVPAQSPEPRTKIAHEDLPAILVLGSGLWAGTTCTGLYRPMFRMYGVRCWVLFLWSCSIPSVLFQILRMFSYYIFARPTHPPINLGFVYFL